MYVVTCFTGSTTCASNTRVAKKQLRIARGMKTREALKIAKRLGATVEDVKRTGEVRIKHPRIGFMVTTRIPERRDTASHLFVSFLRKLFELTLEEIDDRKPSS